MSSAIVYSFLHEMINRHATDLYLTVGVPPTLRIENELFSLSELALTEEDMQVMLNDVLTSRGAAGGVLSDGGGAGGTCRH